MYYNNSVSEGTTLKQPKIKQQEDQGWVSMKIVRESATDTSEYPDRQV